MSGLIMEQHLNQPTPWKWRFFSGFPARLKSCQIIVVHFLRGELNLECERMKRYEKHEGMENESYKTSVANLGISIQHDSTLCTFQISYLLTFTLGLLKVKGRLRQLRMAPKLSRQLLGDKCETCETLANKFRECERLVCSKLLLSGTQQVNKSLFCMT